MRLPTVGTRRRVRGLGLALTLGLLVAPVPQDAPPASAGDSVQALVQEYLALSRSRRAGWMRRHCRVRPEGACERPMGRLGAEYLDLRHRAEVLGQTAPIHEADRLDFDFLAWRTDEAVAAYLETDTTPYERLLLHHTSERVSPARLHELGLEEVQRIRAAMQAWAERVATERQDGAGNVDLRRFLDAARDDERLYAPSREDLLRAAGTVHRTILAHLRELFDHLPQEPLRIVTPREIEDDVMARYAGSSGGAGVVALNPNPRQVPLFVLEALMLHEGMPGHHLQIALTRENARRHDWWGELSPTAYVEGWGLYAESLGDDLGLYRQPLNEFGRLSLQMWRALRLVIDTGLNAYGWDRDRAVEMFLDNTPLPPHQAQVEVQRYLDNPGQAVAYKVGELRFLALRAEAEAALGTDFDLRRFHDVVLRNGPVPLRSLERQVRGWVAGLLQN